MAQYIYGCGFCFPTVFHKNEIVLFCNLLVLSNIWASFYTLSLLSLFHVCVILDYIDISQFIWPSPVERHSGSLDSICLHIMLYELRGWKLLSRVHSCLVSQLHCVGYRKPRLLINLQGSF